MHGTGVKIMYEGVTWYVYLWFTNLYTRVFALFDKISVHGKNVLDTARRVSESFRYDSASDVWVCEEQ